MTVARTLARGLLSGGLLVCLIVGLTPAPTPAHSLEIARGTTVTPWDVPLEAVRSDDGDLALWAYSGDWTHASNQSWTEGEYERTESFSNVPGARATTSFTGTDFTLWGPKGPNGGGFRVTIDCAQTVVGDAYAPSKQLLQSLASVQGLASGVHTVVVEVLGTAAPESSNAFVMLDELTSTSSSTGEDAHARAQGSTSGSFAATPLVLRRSSCGTSTDIVEQLKARATDGRFLVPGSQPQEGHWGAVNAHSQNDAMGPADGPLTIGDDVVDAASIGLVPNQFLSLPLSLPDRPRTLSFTVVANERDAPVRFGVHPDGFGEFLPMTVMTGARGSRTVQTTSSSVLLTPGEETIIVVDLRAPGGEGAYPELVVWSTTASESAAELILVSSRISDVAANRFVRELDGDLEPVLDEKRLSAPASAFDFGPVVLSRVLADADQTAWTGDQSTKPVDPSDPVPFAFGALPSGVPLRVDGVLQAPTTVGIQLPEAPGISSVHVRFETTQRCRSFTARVALDDSSTSLHDASVSVAVFADREALPLQHNGIWRQGQSAKDDASEYASVRTKIARELRQLKLASASGAFGSDESSMRATTALANAEYDALMATAANPEARLMRYTLDGPLRLGSSFSGSSGAHALFHPNPSDVYESVEVVPPTSRRSFPLVVDLISPRNVEVVRAAATSRDVRAATLPSLLARTVDIVIAGTPGAVVDFIDAGLDCVSSEPAPDGSPAPITVLPKYSQIGMPPLFLPSPRDSHGATLDALTRSPVWWDLACPAGPSAEGLAYTATRTRVTSYKIMTGGPDYGFAWAEVNQTREHSTARKPACGLPADQTDENFGPFELDAESPARPDPSTYEWAAASDSDPLAVRLIDITGTWEAKLELWVKTVALETSQDRLSLAIWLALAPFDLPAAIVLNDFVQHALAPEVQAAVGIALLSPSLVSTGIVHSLPAASRLAVGAEESANDVMLISTEQARLDASNGKSVVLTIGDSKVSIPLRADTPQITADLPHRELSTPLVTTDRVVSRMPAAVTDAPWVRDRLDIELARLCKRDTEMDCDPPDPNDGGAPAPKRVKVVSSSVLEKGPRWRPQSYWARYPEAAAQIRTDVGPSGAWTNPEAIRAMEATPGRSDFPLSRVHITDLRNGTRYGTSSINLTPGKVYVYTSGPPWVVNSRGGLSIEDLKSTELLANSQADSAYNLSWLALGRPDLTVYIRASRDPDLLRVAYNVRDREIGLWRYTLQLSGWGGAIDEFNSYRGLPLSVRAQALLPPVVDQANVLIPGFVPGNVITRADLMALEPQSRRFGVTMSLATPGTPADGLPVLQGLEREGLPVLNPNANLAVGLGRFDAFVPPQPGQFVVGAPDPVDLALAQNDPTVAMMFSKNFGRWVPSHVPFDFLEASGFNRGHWAFPGAGETGSNFFVPAPAPGEQFSVIVDEHFVPYIQEP